MSEQMKNTLYPVTTRVSRAMRDEIDAAARSIFMSRSEIIKLAIACYLELQRQKG